jgi:putative exosortase-associated protein (TIGR04073 family)
MAVAVVAVFTLVSPALADTCASPACGGKCKTEQLIGGMGTKFVRGVTNVFTGWIEIPAQICKGYNKACLGGAAVGVFTGVWHAAGRTFSGFYDMAGFWAADPENNDGVGIPLDGDCAWEEGTHYSLTRPSFAKATITPIGAKLARGLGNAVFGVLEVPGQLIKGMKAHACDFGLGKALWYWFSREMDGFYDGATCVLPNPKDTMGMKFDDRWPWTGVGLGDKR